MADLSLLAASYTLQNITPAPAGWRAVYWTGIGHVTEPVALFCLATSTSAGTPPQVVALRYQPMDGWACCEMEPDFCGLLLPGEGLSEYEAQDPHGHVPVPSQRSDQD